ncbi:DUF1546-domain-containing protein [Patellaria atrata CBS 101060]|uniref:TBP-associated factor 6 n=1 Tax=Patellaria atrata CBS 101060 TaxID=1346257 RepID=A0A9P4SF62_9PEZI|nr:DUF1546-domain-containing protein [Patellaria atrata CBS 101060]
MSVWNPDNIRDVAESVGIASLSKDVTENLARDVEFRIQQVLEEALKFMRHSKRTTLNTSDITHALRVLSVEPLYGYESTRPLRFGEASIGPGQPLFYVEDEEVDFEKLINAPLPKVPREITFTAHWLAVEGTQPSIPQNPTLSSAPSNTAKATPTNLAASSTTAKPLVKHVLSKELQLYFDRIVAAMADEHNDEYRLAALASLRTDPGLHQLIPYFVHFVNEKVTHGLKDLFTLNQALHLASALLENPALFMDPYIANLIPAILTCLVGKRLGPPNQPSQAEINGNGNGAHAVIPAHFELRNHAASLLTHILKKYSGTSVNLRPRLARTYLKLFLDPLKPLGVYYGAIIGLTALSGPDGVRQLVLPNLKLFDSVLTEAVERGERLEVDIVAGAIVKALQTLGVYIANRDVMDIDEGDDLRERIVDKVGETIGGRLVELGKTGLIRFILDEKFGD